MNATQHLSPIIPCKDLPGPLSVASLARMGALVPLDATGCYLANRAGTVPGRASIVERIVPPDATACAALALWIWTGGAFPGTLTVISHTHFRALVYGRRMRAYDRRLAADERSRLGGVWVTSPLRTACDLACNDDGSPLPDGRVTAAGIIELMEDFDFTPDDCIALLQRNPRWPGRRRGLETFMALRGSYAPPGADAEADAFGLAEGCGFANDRGFTGDRGFTDGRNFDVAAFPISSGATGAPHHDAAHRNAMYRNGDATQRRADAHPHITSRHNASQHTTHHEEEHP